jgi:hypothetical protein
MAKSAALLKMSAGSAGPFESVKDKSGRSFELLETTPSLQAQRRNLVPSQAPRREIASSRETLLP